MKSPLQLDISRLQSTGRVMASLVLLVMFLVSTSASQTFTTLYNFVGPTDGAIPNGGVINVNGVSYGATSAGGAFNAGTVYKVTNSGVETVIYTFTGTPDGSAPETALVRDSHGNLYGTTSGGGAFGAGTIFKVAPNGVETVLYSFTGGTDGQFPNAISRDSQGNLYGTTVFGGISCTGVLGSCGVAFKLDSAGVYEVLHTFTGAPDGAQPAAGLIRDAAGNLYGSTQLGGDAPASGNGPCGLAGCGTIFKIDTSGNESVLYAFCSEGGTCPQGIVPIGGLIRDKAGSFYGITEQGGSFGWGTVYKLSKPGKAVALYTFTGGSDGGLPKSGLTQDSTGVLYGTTYFGGLEKKACDSENAGCGVVFKITATGKETVVHAFTGGDGGNPVAGVSFDNQGNLYGTTTTGHEAGTVFQLTP